jgi:hypothetical protein
MNMIRIIRGLEAKDIEIVRWRPGMLIEYDDCYGLPLWQIFEVPDSDHKSSLDYFEGV